MREIKPFNQLVGANIQHERELAGYTQEQLSELLDLTPNHLSAIERGVSGISLESLQKLCIILGISADRILFDSPAPSRDLDLIVRKLSAMESAKADLAIQLISGMLSVLSQE